MSTLTYFRAHKAIQAGTHLSMSNGDGEAQVRQALSTFHEDLLTLPADVDLIDSRLINSLAFITLIQNLIDASGCEPDLDAVPIAKLRTIDGLVEIFFGSDAPAPQVTQ